MAPCRARTEFGHPHIQVNANTTFVMEWATGHANKRTDFIFVHEKDEPKLAALTGNYGVKLVSRYIREAAHFGGDAEARALFSGPYWTRNHMGRLGKEWFDVYKYAKLINDDDPLFVVRPWGKGIADKYTGQRAAWLPRTTDKDKRYAYHNPNLPWILAAHRFKISVHRPGAGDTSRFRFPPGTPPGRYVIYYMFLGCARRQCIELSTHAAVDRGHGLVNDLYLRACVHVCLRAHRPRLHRC